MKSSKEWTQCTTLKPSMRWYLVTLSVIMRVATMTPKFMMTASLYPGNMIEIMKAVFLSIEDEDMGTVEAEVRLGKKSLQK